MSVSTGLSPEILIQVSKILLMASFAVCLVRAMRGVFDLHLAFERLVVGVLLLLFFQSGAEVLLRISNELSAAISNLNGSEDLKTLILSSFKKAAQEPGPGGEATIFNIPAVLEQSLRTGVWGILSLIVDWIFLMVSFLLESAREVFWSILVFLFPLACGVYPIFPRMVSNAILYAIELVLWLPMLGLVDRVTTHVAREFMTRPGSLGMTVIAVELLAIILILLIPSVTHKFLSGAFAGDFDSQASLIRMAKSAVGVAKGWRLKA